MNKTTLKQKLLLIALGLFLTLFILEFSLRMAGLTVLYLQDRHNHFSFNPREYRILCLGESTTALGGEDSYPSQLEIMLNKQSEGKKFTVINKGVISTTTNDILAHLDQNLDMYKPQLVIVMMGINDRVYLHDLNKTLWWENIKSLIKDLRVYKLGYLLYEHITHRIKEIKAPNHTVDDMSATFGDQQQTENFIKLLLANCIQQLHQHVAAAIEYQQRKQFAEAQEENVLARQSIHDASIICVELARRYRQQGNYPLAEKVLDQATFFDQHSPDVYQEWGELYLAQGQSALAVKAFQSALVLDPQDSDVLLGLAHAYHQVNDDKAFVAYTAYLQADPGDYWGHIELAKWFKEARHDDLAQQYLERAIAFQPDFDQAYIDLGQLWDDQGQYQKEGELYLKEISLHPKSARLYQALGQFYQRQGRGDLSKQYFQKAAASQMPEYCPATLVNYSLLLDKILSRHIKVIIMQYPLRDAGILKDYLAVRKGVFFVENKNNFKQALAKEKYNYYFKDNFAYDFGHCTRAGNKLIAQNLAPVISKICKNQNSP